jgi:pimeloyl-[acyl-carrier protein] methyl ester esterase
LDGTAQLFEPFVAKAPSSVVATCQPLPCDARRDYDQLASWVIERLPPSRVALIAESFSGPLAIMVANRCPRVTAVVLCASFIEPPLNISPTWLPSFLWNQPPPSVLLSLLLTGGDRALAKSMQCAISTVPASVIAHRVATVLHVNVRDELAALARPLLCLRATRDRVVSARGTEKIRAVKPNAEFADVDAPHLLLQSNPSAAWEVIEPFVLRAEALGAG